MPLLDINKTAAKIKAGAITPSASAGATKVNVTTPVATPTNNASVTKSTPLKTIPTKAKAVDTFGAVSGQSTLGQTVTPGARLSTGQTISKDTAKPVDLGNLNVWGDHAKGAESVAPGTIVKRNDAVVQNLLSQGVTDQSGIKSYLEQQKGFTSATPEEQANTLRALTEQMGITPGATTTGLVTKPGEQPGQAQDLVGLARAKEQADLVTQTQKEIEFAKQQKAKELEIKDIEGNTIKIQSSQRIQQAQNQLDSLKQRYAYLGSQGQPGVSSVQLDAVGKQLTQAEQTFAQLKQMEQNAAQMRELGIKYDAAAFEKEIDDVQYKLDQQVSRAVQGKINEFNTVAGGVDTLEELNQVKGTMMQELDKSIANIAISNQADRQLILDRYNDVIKTNEEFVKNKNTVNKEMSSVLGYYVDGNGSPIMNSQGLPVQIPPKSPMDPIFDKETGTLITFSTGSNGEILANPQQVLQAKQNPRQKGEGGAFYRTNAQGEIEFANAPGVTSGTSGASASYQGPTIPATTIENLQTAYNQFTSIPNGSVVRKGQCGEFVNDYIKKATGITQNLFIDPIDIRATQTNSQNPTVGSVVVMRSSGSPDATKYGHVAIVTGVNADGTINIKEQNGLVKGKVGSRTIGTDNVVGYFDPTKGLQSGKGFDQTDITVFNNMTPSDRKKMQNDPLYNQFVDTKTNIMKDKNSDINDILQYSMGGRGINQTQEGQLSKFSQALSQLGDIQKLISKQETGPVIGKLKQMNPYDTDAQVLKANLSALIPNLARGVYGEVGVLTDADVQQYAKTIPNLTSTNDVNKAVLAMTLKTIANGYKSKLQNMAGGGFDVSGYSGIYNDLIGKVEELNAGLSTQSNAKSLLGDMVNIVKKTGSTTPIKIGNITGKVR